MGVWTFLMQNSDTLDLTLRIVGVPIHLGGSLWRGPVPAGMEFSLMLYCWGTITQSNNTWHAKCIQGTQPTFHCTHLWCLPATLFSFCLCYHLLGAWCHVGPMLSLLPLKSFLIYVHVMDDNCVMPKMLIFCTFGCYFLLAVCTISWQMFLQTKFIYKVIKVPFSVCSHHTACVIVRIVMCSVDVYCNVLPSPGK